MGKGRGGRVGWTIGTDIGREVAWDDFQVDGRALGTEALIIEVVKGAAQAVVEDGVSIDCKGIVTVDAEASGVESVVLYMEIVLELVVGHD